MLITTKYGIASDALCRYNNFSGVSEFLYNIFTVTLFKFTTEKAYPYCLRWVSQIPTHGFRSCGSFP
jgi:hypothetical protein